MRAGIVVEVTPEDRVRLERIVGDRNTPQKHSARARVILATAEDCGTLEIVRRSGLSKPVVWRWQERFMHEGVDGLQLGSMYRLLRIDNRRAVSKRFPKSQAQTEIRRNSVPVP